MNIPSESVKFMVADKLAKIKGGEGVETHRTNTVVRYWEGIVPGQVAACVAYLREYTSSKNRETPCLSVEDLQVDKTTLTGRWRGGKVTTTRDDDKTKTPGNYTIYQELHEGFIQTIRDANGAISFSEWITDGGHLYSSGVSSIKLLLPNVDPAKVEQVRRDLHSVSTYTNPVCRYETLTGGTYYYEDSSPRHEQDGSYSIELILWSIPLNLSYLVVGRRITALVNEEQRLYQDIPSAYVTQLVNDLVVLNGYTLVDGDARKTTEAGIFDVYLTLRTMLIPPGGQDVLIGGSGGLFKTQVRMRRNVPDASLGSTVAGLTALALIDNVRATNGSADGIWDIVYSLLIVPPIRIEAKKSFDRRELMPSLATTYKHETVFSREIISVTDDEPTYGYIEHLQRFPTAYGTSWSNKHREVTLIKVISYSAESPGTVTATWDGITGTGDEIVQLSNGLWQKTSESLGYQWWSSV